MLLCLFYITDNISATYTGPLQGVGVLVDFYRVFGILSELIRSTTHVWIQNITFKTSNPYKF